MARQISPKSEAMRDLLGKNPELTWEGKGDVAGARVMLERLGYTEAHKDPEKRVNGNAFNVMKHMLKSKKTTVVSTKGTGKGKRGRRPAEPRRSVLPLNNEAMGRTMTYVTQAGGLAALKQSVEAKQQQITALQAEVAEMTTEIENFESLSTAVAAAS